MAPTQPLFVLQIPGPSGATSTTNGSIICVEAAPQVYVLSFSSPPDNRLTPAFNATFLLALDIIETQFRKGVVVSTSSITKFYSNGLNYEAAVKDSMFFRNSLYPLWRRLLTYSMPTVALINGHAFAGGMMTAMMHDYRIMNPHKGFVCLNELDFGAPLRPPMASIFRVKLPSISTLRNMVLESRRYPALEALKEGIIDGVGGPEETLAFIEEMKLVQKAQSPSYGLIKEELYREVVVDLDESPDVVKLDAAKDLGRARRELEARQRVEQWERATGRERSKL